jgi:phosphatidylglycerophosphatase A
MIRKAAITFFGLGYLRPAPGTWGSAGALGVAALLVLALRAAGALGAALDVVLIALIGVACAGSVVWGPWAIAFYADKARKHGDPSHFVLDEVAGQWVAVLFLPIAGLASLWQIAGVYAMQFLLFRIFDVIKPPPARQLEKLPAGWGVLCDDLAAGALANVVGQIVVRLWLLPG